MSEIANIKADRPKLLATGGPNLKPLDLTIMAEAVHGIAALPSQVQGKIKITPENWRDLFHWGVPTKAQLVALGLPKNSPATVRDKLLGRELKVSLWLKVAALKMPVKDMVEHDSFDRLLKLMEPLKTDSAILIKDSSLRAELPRLFSEARQELKRFNTEAAQLMQELSRLAARRERRETKLAELERLHAECRANLYEYRRKKANRALANEQLRIRVFATWGNKCANCPAVTDLSIDHIKSVFDGGSNEESNLQVLCRPCNSSKGKKSLLVANEKAEGGAQ